MFFDLSGLEEVRDFGKFRNLQIVWLNGNKVTPDSCHSLDIISKRDLNISMYTIPKLISVNNITVT